MKKIPALIAAVLGLVLGSVLLTGCSSSGSVTNVDAPTFLSTAKQPGVVVVDVRTAGEYAAGHIDGAINVDVESPSFDAQLAKLDKGATYAVYCHSGRRSGIATGKMGDAGFTTVYNLQGGISDLASAGGQVVAS
ncbi:MAG: rhodanese-like domain-containing protein [Candidatus Nanopelagicales bacterium]